MVILGIAATGCVRTVDGNKAGGLPLIRNKMESLYDCPADMIFAAAKEVVAQNGVLLNEGTLFGQTNAVNQVARTVTGSVQERRVWIRIQQIDPKVASMTIQTITKAGGSDMDLAASLDKQIALKLVR
ncbi:MAG: hypothetical protein U1F65_00795 [Verrucomicrobiota bacterium]